MGVPTVSVCTDEFYGLARFEAEQRGMPHLPIVPIPHPVAGLDPTEVMEKGRAVADEIVKGLTEKAERPTPESPASSAASSKGSSGGAAAKPKQGASPAARAERVRELLEGAFDIHVHSGPDATSPRRAGAFELAEYAARLKMGGMVLKDHHGSTVALAATADRHEGVRMFGGVTLNTPVGGLNAEAVEVAGKAGGRFAWMPTKSAETHRSFHGGSGGISLLDQEGELKPEVLAILEAARAHDVIVGTGHISVKEMFALVKGAIDVGAPPPVVTHANTMIALAGLSAEQMKDLSDLGAFIELSLYPIMPTNTFHEPEELARIVEVVGSERAILSTDFGQIHLPIAPEGMHMGVGMLLKLGVPEGVVRSMVHDNPRRLLGL